MTGYTKLFGTIIASTIWRESKETKIVWITMLAMANKDGLVEAAVPGLADMARVTIEECEEALAKLSAPDPYSRTKDHEGRRIEVRDGGWLLLNHRKYREKMSAEDRREYKRQWDHDNRPKRPNSKQRDEPPDTTPDKTRQNPTDPTHSEAKAEAPTTTTVPPPGATSSLKGGDGKDLPTSEEAKAIAALFNRKLTTPWSPKEIKSFKDGMKRKVITVAAVAELVPYYAAERAKGGNGIHRRDLLTFLNNFDGELDRATAFKANPNAHAKHNSHHHQPPTRNLGHNAGVSYANRPKKPTPPATAHNGSNGTLL